MNIAQPIETITRRSLHVELVDRLHGLIVEGTLAPGTKVPERELCDQFGVSRTPMREALKVLASDGLVTLEPNRGAWVTRGDDRGAGRGVSGDGCSGSIIR